MPRFTYSARQPDGRTVTGEQEAASEYEALRILQQQGFIVTRVQEGKLSELPTNLNNVRRHKRIRSRDMIMYIRQMATLLSSNVPLLRALDVIRSQTESQHLADVMEKMASDIRAGATFKDAMGRHPRVFPVLWSFLIDAGEVSGKLPLVLEQLALYVETSQRIKTKFITAMFYPAILTLVASGAVSVFLLFVIPIFKNLFDSFGAKLPLLTRMVIATSDGLRHYFIFVLLVGFAVGFFLNRFVRTPSGRATADRLVLRVPFVGAFFKDIILARVASSLYILIKSGVNILRGLEITAKSSGNIVFEDALLRVRDEVQHGRPIAVSLAKHPIFPGMLVQMVMIGEESGRLEELLARVAAYYEEQVDVFVNRLSTVLEPLILVVMGGIVGVLVIAMFLPIFRLSSVIR